MASLVCWPAVSKRPLVCCKVALISAMEAFALAVPSATAVVPSTKAEVVWSVKLVTSVWIDSARSWTCARASWPSTRAWSTCATVSPNVVVRVARASRPSSTHYLSAAQTRLVLRFVHSGVRPAVLYVTTDVQPVSELRSDMALDLFFNQHYKLGGHIFPS